MFTFRGTTEDGRQLVRRIRRILSERHAMHIGELHTRLGIDKEFVHAELEKMRSHGEIELLRPIGYSKEDHDFFRLIGQATELAQHHDAGTSHALRTRQKYVQLAGKAMACFYN